MLLVEDVEVDDGGGGITPFPGITPCKTLPSKHTNLDGLEDTNQPRTELRFVVVGFLNR